MNANRLLITLLTMAIAATTAMAEVITGSCGASATYTLNTETGLLRIEGDGEMEFYSTSKPAPWSCLCEKIEKAEICDGITSVSNYAFYGCESLTTVGLPNSLKRIGGRAFAACPGISSIAIPNSVTSIGEFAFSGCSNLKSVIIPASVTSIAEGTFSACSNLTSVTIGSSVKKIGGYAFSQCPSLTSIMCEASTPPTIYDALTVFYGDPTYKGTLYVPAASVETYKDTNGWKAWGTIKGIGQDVITGNHAPTPSPISHKIMYDLQGRRVQKPGKGLFIQDGRKVVVR